ncbi:MAG: ArsA family ATPase [Candidatus Thermoplasmatota archaeon]|jgi:arsenite-transporting ATPase|nr:ArsA family ATPase [Candidatus Thermoplasmatota archaeon]MCL5785049.1 ArsA family ATPase [Candidatus Thermoplasmatota archaeon]
MSTRIILFTGKGGVGKTSVAASTAILLAKKGFKTIIISTDPAHSLSDAFATEIGPKIRKISDNLDAQEISAIDAVNKYWDTLKGFLSGLFSTQGLDPVSSEEIATLPGFDEGAELLYVSDYVKQGNYDVIVMDSAPTGESLKLLSFPEAMSWYMEKLFPIGRRTAKLVRPLARPFLSVPVPDDSVFKSMENLYDGLKEVRNILVDDKITSIRLVCTPDRMSLNETMRAYTYLLLYGYPVDALVINKIFHGNSGEFFEKWRRIQEGIMKEMDSYFQDLKIFRLMFSNEEPTGSERLQNLGREIYGNSDPYEVFSRSIPIEYVKSGDAIIAKIKLPFASKERMNLYNRSGELVIEVDNWRRVFYLPQTLQNKQPTSAEFNNGYLHIQLR